MGFPNPLNQLGSRILYTTEMASGSVGGFLSGVAASRHTATWDGSYGSHMTVYVMSSGANGPAAIRLADMTVGSTPMVTFPALAANSVVAVQVGPGCSGADGHAGLTCYNFAPPSMPALLVDPGAGASWFRIVVVGR